MPKINDTAIKQLFTEARTHHAWLPKEIDDSTLLELYEIMKWGPTSCNGCPMRIVFVKSKPEKDKLMGCLEPSNVVKAQSAPVSAILAMNESFYDNLPELFPHNPAFRDFFATNQPLASATAFRNSSLQGAYFIIAARALGLDCGPMSGFDNKKVDALFLKGTSLKSNFICNLGYADHNKVHARGPRLSFADACKII